MLDTVSFVVYMAAIISAIGVMIWLWFAYNKQKEKNAVLQEKYSKELHYRKSSEVRLGKIGENLAPFVRDWPWDPKNFRFLGNPIDGVQFNDDEIVFVEIKTGAARLSRSQKDFRDLVKEGKVSFVTFKITGDGTKLVREGAVQ